jgi:hypothetical protein
VGVIVAGITCDGPSSNFAMFSNLGASIQSSKILCIFKNFIINAEDVAVLDPITFK